MVNAFNKKQSKRMTCHKKYKIRKKVREHNKKLAKTLKDSVTKKKRVAGAVPNMAPFKEELLLEAMKQTEERREEKKAKKKQPQIITKKPDTKPVAMTKGAVSVHVVISQCDVLLWVIDIRSVNECLCQHIQETLQESKKTVIFVLNKIDLVPFDVVKKWYSVLSDVSPTFLFKSTEIILTECEQIIPALKQVLAKHCGSKQLLSYLKQTYTEEITKVGVIGTKQVGKSSVISTILRGSGRTKAKRSEATKLNENIKLVTTPGTIESEKTGMLHVLDDMSKYMNYAPAVLTALSEHITKEQALLHFTLPDYTHPQGLLDALAIRYNLTHDSAPDHPAVGRLILKQIRDCKLKFYVDTKCDKLVDIPESMLSEIEKFVFSGAALRLTNSNLNIVIEKTKKSKGYEMDTVEEGEETDEDALLGDSDVEECSELESDEEMC